jgi:toxin ParE1/3/4
MKGRFVLKPRAQADLDEIWDYTAERWGQEQAETYTRQLWRNIQAIADQPSLGRGCDEVRAGYRLFPSGSHILLYRLHEDGIEVVRVLHERMDHERHLP